MKKNKILKKIGAILILSPIILLPHKGLVTNKELLILSVMLVTACWLWVCEKVEL